jgi:23S rRNA (guanosine2251-2'-O)-methyltransferase
MVKKLSHSELVNRQQTQKPFKPQFTVVLNNIRSLYNVGSIFRTADGVGIEKLWLCGITGIPPSTKISKTALGAEKVLPWEFAPSARQCLESLKAQGYQLVLLEQTKSSVSYQEFVPKEKICLIVGNEIEGVSEDLLSLCDQAIEIEMTGLKISLNVTVAFGVAAYHIRQKLMERVA